MSDIATIDLSIRKGETYGKVVQWGQGDPQYVLVTALQKRAPLRLVVPDHGIPDKWFARFDSMPGIRGLDTGSLEQVTVLDKDTIEMHGVNGARLRGDYSGSDGYLVFQPPVDMTGFTARADIREYAEADDAILRLNTENGGVVIDVAKSAIAILVDPEQTEGLPHQIGVYDLEVVAPGGQVYGICGGRVRFHDEVTHEGAA